MNNKENFVAYEYKKISAKHESASMYTDCLSNFGWELIDQRKAGFQPNIPQSPVDVSAYNIPSPTNTDGLDMVELHLKRNRRIDNKPELDRLERKCEEALAAIHKLENKKNAYTMGTSLGIGIIGAVFIGLAAYNFIFSNIAFGVVFAAIGAVGCGIGFLANRKVGTKKAVQTEPMIQEQLNLAYAACEQAHALLA